MTESNTELKLPVNVSDFKTIRQNGMFYADKTHIIPMVDDYSKGVLIRPQRFGKTLLLSMLHCYYDMLEKENFDRLFQGLYIGSHPTINKNAYQILHLDFLEVNCRDEYECVRSLEGYCKMCCLMFLDRYADFYPEVSLARASDLIQRSYGLLGLDIISRLAERFNFSVMVTVDNYDAPLNHFLADLQYPDNGTGWLMRCYANLVQILRNCFSDVLLTGILPAPLDSFNSIFSEIYDLNSVATFQAATGFTGAELMELCTQAVSSGKVPDVTPAQLCARLQSLFGNYVFGAKEDKVPVTQPFAAVHYLHAAINRGGKVKPSYANQLSCTSLYELSTLPVLLEEQDRACKTVCETISSLGLHGSVFFALADLLHGKPRDNFSNFCTLLHYFGAITPFYVSYDMEKCCLPNETVQQEFFACVQQLLLPQRSMFGNEKLQLQKVCSNICLQGTWREFFYLAAKLYPRASMRHYFAKPQEHLQLFIKSLLLGSSYFRQDIQFTDEDDYRQWLFLPRADMQQDTPAHSYMLICRHSLSPDNAAEEAQRQKDRALLRQYLQNPELQKLCAGTIVHAVLVVFAQDSWQTLEEVQNPS